MGLWHQDWEEYGESLQLALGGPESQIRVRRDRRINSNTICATNEDTLAATTFELDDDAVDTTIEGVPCRVLNLKVRSKVLSTFSRWGYGSWSGLYGRCENRHIANTLTLR